MKYYLIETADQDFAVYEHEGDFYPVFIEKYQNEAVDMNKYQYHQIDNVKEIEALDKYMHPYEDNKIKVYMAGPLFNEGDRYTNQINSDQLRDNGYTTFLPQEVVIDSSSTILVKSACFFMDLKAIRECDYLLANCNGIDIDSGTAAEIGLAYGLEKPIIIYKSDVRNYYSPDFKLNNFVGGLVNNKVYSSMREILDFLSKQP